MAYTLGLMQPKSVETQEQTGHYRGFLRLMLGGVNRVLPVCHRIIIARLSLPHFFPIPDAAPGVDSSGSDRSGHLNTGNKLKFIHIWNERPQGYPDEH